MAERERTRPDHMKGLHKYPEPKRSEIWQKDSDRIYRYSRNTMLLYRTRFHAEVNSILTEFKFQGIDTGEIEIHAEQPINPLVVEQICTELAALAGRLRE